jgi:8-oxo-dGTP diphosphatase
VIAATYRVLLVLFGRLPRRLRRQVVRLLSPSYTVGAVCVIERADGHILLIQQRYRKRWGLPGGLLSRREHAADAARREVREEIGLAVELIGDPTVVVEPSAQRVDVAYVARLTDPAAETAVLRPTSPEITAVEWFPIDAPPELQDETVAVLEALQKLGPVER